MTHSTLVLTASLGYLLATVVFGAYLLHFQKRLALIGRLVMAVGAIVHVTAIVLGFRGGVLELDTYSVLLLGSAALVVGYLLIQFKRPTPLFGAFLAPVVMIVLYSLHVHVFSKEAGLDSRDEMALVTPIHIVGSLLGFLILTVAAGAAVLHVIQEYRLKTKQLTLNAPGNLPPLSTLEDISHKALIIGFPIYSIGMALGAVWFFGETETGSTTRHFIMAAFSWVLYAVTLCARVAVGWRGRRAALLTLVAFVAALFVVLLSALRSGG